MVFFQSRHRSVGADIQAHDFSIFALEEDFHGAAADFTVYRKPLFGFARVQLQFKRLPTIWTLDFFRFLHLPKKREIAIVLSQPGPSSHECQPMA
jgi:hypothetical protein